MQVLLAVAAVGVEPLQSVLAGQEPEPVGEMEGAVVLRTSKPEAVPVVTLATEVPISLAELVGAAALEPSGVVEAVLACMGKGRMVRVLLEDTETLLEATAALMGATQQQELMADHPMEGCTVVVGALDITVGMVAEVLSALSGAQVAPFRLQTQAIYKEQTCLSKLKTTRQ